MDNKNLLKKIGIFKKNKHLLKQDPQFIKEFEENFAVRYTHESTAIEGNTLSLRETSDVLLGKKSVANKNLRELYEVINHDMAFEYIKKCMKMGKEINEDMIKRIHELLMDKIIQGGSYRDVNIAVIGSENDFPDQQKVPSLMNNFFKELSLKTSVCGMPGSGVDPIDLACWTHAAFINIHPFRDGNGRTARLIMNYQLMSQGYIPISIPKDLKSQYCNALDTYQSSNNMEPFKEIVVRLEEAQLDIINDNQKKFINKLEGATHEL